MPVDFQAVIKNPTSHTPSLNTPNTVTAVTETPKAYSSSTSAADVESISTAFTAVPLPSNTQQNPAYHPCVLEHNNYILF